MFQQDWYKAHPGMQRGYVQQYHDLFVNELGKESVFQKWPDLRNQVTGRQMKKFEETPPAINPSLRPGDEPESSGGGPAASGTIGEP
jgi:hypothetical protein